MGDHVGQQLGNYRLLRFLGHGGFATVYLGEHVHLGTQAAVKLLNVYIDSRMSERFRTEAQTIARLEHPHIVRVLDFGIERDIPFLIMNYAPGGSLRQRHPKGTHLPLESVVSYVRQIAFALQYAHNEKVIHRDIKPENMLLDRHNDVLLSDFGLALALPQTGSLSTQAMAGTPPYMAPEQIDGKPQLASDQYALGIVIYEWLSGTPPFLGSHWEIISQHMYTPPPPLHEKIPSLSPAVEEVVFKALSKEPRQRFASVQDFAVAFEQVYQHFPALFFSPSPPSRVAPPPDIPSMPPRADASPKQSGFLPQPNPAQVSSSINIPSLSNQQLTDVAPLADQVQSQKASARIKRGSIERSIGLTILLLVLILGGVASYFVLGPGNTPLTRGNGNTDITQPPSTSSSLSTPKSHPVPLGWPVIDDYSPIEVADATKSYSFIAHVVDQSIDKTHGKPVHASDITCKLWLIKRVPENGDVSFPLNRLQDVTTLQQPLTGTGSSAAQGLTFEEITPGLTFAAETPQTGFCDPNGRAKWTYSIDPSVAPGQYDLVVLADWQGVSFNWSWLAIKITTGG